MKKLLATLLFVAILLSSLPFTPVSATQSPKTETAPKEKQIKWPKGPKPSSLSAESAIVMDLTSGLILYEKNIHDQHYPASITKIMTALLCLENASLGEVVTFTEDEVCGLEYGASNVATEIGEQFTMEQSLYAIMLESANEVCLGVADHISGSISKFSDLMNKRAAELGCKNTHFVNPNGLHNDKHYTSAYDMALISRAAMQNSTFRKITATKKYTLPKTNKGKVRYPWSNHQQMLTGTNYPRYLYDGCIGGKTGYTSRAMSTLVTFAQRDNMQLVCVVMRAASPKSAPNKNQYTDTADLLDFAFENYKSYDMNASTVTTDTNESPLFNHFNTLFDTEASSIQIGNDGKIILPNGIDITEAVRTVDFYPDITLQTGENIIGSVTYTYGEKTVGSTNIYFNKIDTPTLTQGKAIEEVKTKNIVGEGKHKSRILKITIICVIFVLLVAFALYYVKVRLKRRSLSRRKRRKLY